jgi:magnesium-transporting ATPase (P-type)
MNEKNIDQEIISPQPEPKSRAQGFSPLGSSMAAFGATLLMLCFAASAMVATVWAFAKLIGVPDIVMYVVMAVGLVPVVWVTVWTAGRAWHVERLLASGKDIDVPVFSMSHYFKKR